jgi:hypothetical protein
MGHAPLNARSRLTAAAIFGAVLCAAAVLDPVRAFAADEPPAGQTTTEGDAATQDQQQTPPPMPNGCPFRNKKLELIT